MKALRKGDFKLGQLHGKLQAENKLSEAHIQRTVFLSQKMKLWRHRNEAIEIRVFGYEMPLKCGCTRGECVDLVGYDKDHNLYLIELKKETSSEQMGDVIAQLNGYEKVIKRILPDIEKEFKKQYFLPINFKGIKKIILAPRGFFRQKAKNLFKSNVEYCYFRDIDINNHKPGEVVNIHIAKRLKCN